MEVCLNAGATIDEIMETLKMAFFRWRWGYF
ncbi:hypothetical protein QUF88_07125 [Bacillus sp. DX1.1]|nr:MULTISPECIES: hypothetical protein [unclassified Bacillus (in: firmicutes)]MDM5153609.1 hypothetical protein [Bacillus sp. DX1.1]WJE83997.1 hypothetical protein QRE67_04640 [Bacillus sp. DX3.1]